MLRTWVMLGTFACLKDAIACLLCVRTRDLSNKRF